MDNLSVNSKNHTVCDINGELVTVLRFIGITLMRTCTGNERGQLKLQAGNPLPSLLRPQYLTLTFLAITIPHDGDNHEQQVRGYK